MKILVVQGNPNPESFTHANAMHYVDVAKQNGHQVSIIDLSQDNFDPVLRYGYHKHMDDESYPKYVQDLITKADHIAFFFPVWWSAEPSVLKGLIDRTLTPRFAYSRDNETGKIKKLLTGKTADVFITSHAPTIFYKSIFGNVIFRWKNMILNYCGIKMQHGFVLGKMDDPKKDTAQRRQKYMQKCANTLIK
ncbi:NAD(P)H-dependent oxidoreductase [Apilactobacillus xinyiensis]|uniref:NAD(P)H-dependent oxidoreductase n=1 Tax=Apilactobacillus xinyiensis TaxID=2841032 RepID=UPI00200EE6AD|nr:NAD(P)H-dependent oxidoreductase [Apilactobacillus xinyiensis]MCL0319351.1 NAD(P)H-dependent oxidoreductase [Apilactobacillus xinyiensis]